MIAFPLSSDVTVPINDSRGSTDKIKTNGLGPCLGFLIDLNIDGYNVCVLSHYSFSINEEKFKTDSSFLIEILYFIAAELQHSLDFTEFQYDGKPRLSNNDQAIKQTIYGYWTLLYEKENIRLLIAGGDVNTSQRIEHVLRLLNKGQDFNIKNETDDEDLHFLYDQLITNIWIIKPVSKMLSNAEEAVARESNKGNDYPYICFRYSCKTKDITLFIEWYGSNPDILFGILELNLMKNISHIKWKLIDKAPRDDKQKQERLKHALQLIPAYPFLSLPDFAE